MVSPCEYEFYNYSNSTLTLKQESPHEHQQNLLLSRIITNVEKLNEAVVVMNKTLQVRKLQSKELLLLTLMLM